DGHADDLAQAKPGIVRQVSDLAAGQGADETAHRKGYQGIDGNPAQRAEGQQDNHHQGAGNGLDHGGQLHVVLAFQILIGDGNTLLVGQHAGQEDGDHRGAEGGEDVLDHQGGQVQLEG